MFALSWYISYGLWQKLGKIVNENEALLNIEQISVIFIAEAKFIIQLFAILFRAAWPDIVNLFKSCPVDGSIRLTPYYRKYRRNVVQYFKSVKQQGMVVWYSITNMNINALIKDRR